ncbi:MAG: hypothetical protein GY755_25530 [Chloroflexi bacterium]|nr:hypothetical protein [Chloroflexota bacterium]
MTEKNMDEIRITAFETTCSSCEHVFSVPALSDFSYGQNIFYSEDGRYYIHANAFEASAKLIHVLLPKDCGSELFWFSLATITDKINGKSLSVNARCPRCTSASVKRNLGKETGDMSVVKATYHDFVFLPREDIIRKVKETVKQFIETNTQ